MNIEHLILPFFLLWFFLLLMLLLRRNFSLVWKLSASLILLFYLLWYFQNLNAAYLRYRQDFFIELFSFFKTLFHFLPVVLLLAWPLTLFITYKHPLPKNSEHILRNITLLTLFFWLFWIVSFYVDLRLESWVKGLLFKKFSLPPWLQPVE